MEALWQDLRYAARGIAGKPAFAAVAIVTLGLGIGANTAIFSVVNGVLLRPLPYKDPDRLVRIVQHRPNAPQGIPARMTGMSIDDLQAWRPRATTLSHIAAYGRDVSTLTGREEPIRLTGASVSPSLFPMLGARPFMGRVFEEVEEKPGSESVVILHHSVWQRYFNSDPDILGRHIMLEGRAYSVVGIMPETFEFPDRETSFWIPFVLSPSIQTPGRRMIQIAQTIARVKDDVTMAQATAEANMIFRQLREEEAAVDAQAAPDAPPSASPPTRGNAPAVPPLRRRGSPGRAGEAPAGSVVQGLEAADCSDRRRTSRSSW